MENASKALIIAGAILLAILIIALGVFIFQRAQSATSDLGGIDETKLQSVNQKFENYEGKNISGSDVRALIDLVRTNNNKYSDATLNRLITINGEKDPTKMAELKTGVEVGATYTVQIIKYYTTGTTQGYVEEITFSKN